MEVEEEDENKEPQLNGGDPAPADSHHPPLQSMQSGGTPDTERCCKEAAGRLCLASEHFREEAGSRGTSPRPREGDGSSREVSYRHPTDKQQPLSAIDQKLLREPREGHRHRRYHSGYKSRYSRDISITQMAVAEDDNISALQQVINMVLVNIVALKASMLRLSKTLFYTILI